MAEALGVHGGMLLGGDCSGGGQRVLAITALGLLPLDRGGAIRRKDGRVGDFLVSTGPHGLSRLGLALLRQEVDETLVPAEVRIRAITAHRRPRPRHDAVKALAESLPCDQPWRVGGCDSSDGLAAAAVAVAAASGCGALLDRARLPLDPAMAQLPQSETWCLSGGEDFELVLALEPIWATRLVERLPGAALIGALVEQAGPELLRWAGSGEPLGEAAQGFGHFR
jgi:thiamine-monophosphate kinase